MRIAILLFYFLWIAACSSLHDPALQERTPASFETLPPTQLLNRLQDFASDGCPKILQTISYPQEDQWQLCCVEHDRAYWKGGSYEERQKADSDLQACVTSRGFHDAARLIYYSVRSDHKNALDTVRWGYGWMVPRSLSPHTPEEKAEIDKNQRDIASKNDQFIKAPKNKKIPSLTGNRCLDGALTVLQKDLNKVVTPTQVFYESKNLVIGFEDTVKISSRECPLPYVFRFRMKSKNDCKGNKTSPLQLDTFEIPGQCE